MKQINKTKHQEIINKFKSGNNLPSIGEELNVSRQWISQVLKQNGINPREINRNNLNQKLDILSIKINRDLKDKLSIKQIVNKYRLTPYQVDLLKERNIDLTIKTNNIQRNQLINKLYMKGSTAKEIIKQIKTITTEDGIYNIVKELNGGILPKRVNTLHKIKTKLVREIKQLRKKYDLPGIHNILLEKGYTNTHGKPLNLNTITYYNNKC
jgi:hypothetical protein